MKKPVVIKIGGAIIDGYNQGNTSALIALLSVIASLKDQPVVIVHGGGCIVNELLTQAGFITEKKHGLRVSPKAQIPIISGVLAGHVNKTIVACAANLKLAAVGLSLTDGQMVQCQLSPLALGQVGVPEPFSSVLLDTLLKANFLPIISSIGALNNGELVNVNADDAAVVICQLLNADLLLLSDVNGVKGTTGEYLTSLNAQQAEQLIDSGAIVGGMTAKVNAALRAANKLRRSIAIASWQSPEQIIDLLNGVSIGTRIQPSGC